MAKTYTVVPTNQTDPVTPYHKVHEGISSTGSLLAAPWLPLIRQSHNFNTWVVMTRGTPIAFASKVDPATKQVVKFAVPAGYALDTGKTIVYTRDDVRNEVTNAAGNPVTEGEAVLESMEAEGWKISAFVGIAEYDVFVNPGSVDQPCDYVLKNFNPQYSLAFCMDYVFRAPMVADKATYDKAPLAGISAFIGTEALPGQFITYDKDSKYVLADPAGFGYGGVDPEYIVGQVHTVHLIADPADYTKTLHPVNSTDYVVAPRTYGGKLQEVPNVTNNGTPQDYSFANAYGQVIFSLTTR